MGDDLRNKAVKGLSWAGIERIGTQIAQLVLNILIARILLPADYGVIGMLAIFMALSQTFLDSGFANALIQKKDRNEIDYSTAFYFNVAVAVCLYLILCLCAPLIASFYDTPVLVRIIRVYTLSVIINALTIVQTARLTIELRFMPQAVAAVLSVLFSGVLGLFLAWRGLGVWALVWQGLSYAVIRFVILTLYSRWRPLPVFSMASFRRLFSFGSKLLLSGTINTIYNNLSTIIIGRCFNASDLGFFTRANQFAMLPTQAASDISLKVSYPLLSSMQDDDGRVLSAYKKLLRVPVFILYPVLLGMTVVAEPLVAVLLGDVWLPCVPYLRILSISGLCYPLTTINLNLLYVKGRTDLVLKLEFIKKPIAFALLFAAIPFGVEAMCWSLTVYSVVAYTINCHYTKRLYDFGFLSQTAVVLPIVSYSLIMAMAVMAVMLVLPTQSLRLTVGIAVGITVYALVALMFRDSTAAEIINLLKTKIAKSKC